MKAETHKLKKPESALRSSSEFLSFGYIHPRTVALALVLFLLVSAVWRVRGQFAGLALYKVPITSGGAEAGWGYMSPGGAGAQNGSLDNEWTPAQAKAQTVGTRIYPRTGTYVEYTPDLVVTQPSVTPEGYLGSGEPLYWTYITPDQIP